MHLIRRRPPGELTHIQVHAANADKFHMKMAGDMLLEVVMRLRGDAKKSASQKRRNPRVGMRCHVELVNEEDRGSSKVESVTLRDISVDGICLLAHRPMPLGSLFMVRLPTTDGEMTEAIYQACRSRALPGGLYSVAGMLIDLRGKQAA